jgi:hypothetical protein
MEVGDVRIAEDADFQKVKDMCQCHDNWKQEYNKNGTTVWTKSNDVSDFKLVKVSTHFCTPSWEKIKRIRVFLFLSKGVL